MNRNFGLTGIKTTAINMFIDDLSRKSSASAVADRGVAMQATQGHGKKQQYKRGKDNKKRLAALQNGARSIEREPTPTQSAKSSRR